MTIKVGVRIAWWGSDYFGEAFTGTIVEVFDDESFSVKWDAGGQTMTDYTIRDFAIYGGDMLHPLTNQQPI